MIGILKGHDYRSCTCGYTSCNTLFVPWRPVNLPYHRSIHMLPKSSDLITVNKLIRYFEAFRYPWRSCPFLSVVPRSHPNCLLTSVPVPWRCAEKHVHKGSFRSMHDWSWLHLHPWFYWWWIKESDLPRPSRAHVNIIQRVSMCVHYDRHHEWHIVATGWLFW